MRMGVRSRQPSAQRGLTKEDESDYSSSSSSDDESDAPPPRPTDPYQALRWDIARIVEAPVSQRFSASEASKIWAPYLSLLKTVSDPLKAAQTAAVEAKQKSDPRAPELRKKAYEYRSKLQGMLETTITDGHRDYVAL